MSSDEPPFRAALNWGCLLILATLAAVARLSFPDLYEFRHDSAYWALEAGRILDGHYLPLVGQQVGSVSIELHNGPLMSYLTAAVFRLGSAKPELMVAAVGLANVAAVFLTCWLGVVLQGWRCGLIAGALQALSPWLVLFGRMLWPQSLLPLLVPGVLLLLLAGYRKERGWHVLLAGVAIGLGLQLHLSVLALGIAVTLWLLLVSVRRVAHIVQLLLGSAIGYAPLLIHDVTHQFQTLQGLLGLSSLHAAAEPFGVHAIRTLWQFSNVVSGQALWFSKLALRGTYLSRLVDWPQGIVATLWFAAAGVWALQRVWTGIQRKSATEWHGWALLLLVCGIPLAQMILGRGEVQRHYFIFLFPTPFILMGAVTSAAWWPSRVTHLVCAVLLILNVYTVVAGYRYLAETGGNSGVGVVLGDKRAAVDAILALSPAGAVVALDSTQESSPYVFLFGRLREIHTEGNSELPDALSWGTASGRYRIIEKRYSSRVPWAGESVVFESRGIVVVQNTK